MDRTEHALRALYDELEAGVRESEGMSMSEWVEQEARSNYRHDFPLRVCWGVCRAIDILDGKPDPGPLVKGGGIAIGFSGFGGGMGR